MAPPQHLREIGEVIVVGVGVVDEAALLDEELAGVDGGAVAAVPAEGALPHRLLERLDRPQHVPALRLAAEPPHLLPAPAVAARFVTSFPDPGRHLGVALERGRGGEEGNREPEAVHQALDPPHPRPRTVFVDGLGREVAIGRVHHVGDLGQDIVLPVARGMGVLRPLLVVEDDVDGDPGTVRPAHIRHVAAVADVVSPGTGNVLVDELSQCHGSTSSSVNRVGEAYREDGTPPMFRTNK